MFQKLLFLVLGISIVVNHAHGGRIRRVIGGRKMTMGAWPWLVSLNFKEQHAYLALQGLDHLCGATLIHPSWVLTAAHCVHHTSGSGLGEPGNWEAVLGEYNRKVEEETEQKIPVEQIYVFPNYALYPNITGDIALLKLSRPATETSAVRALPLDTLRAIPDAAECEAAGWGQHTANDDVSDPPQYGNGTIVPHIVSLHKVPDADCRAAYLGQWPLVDDYVCCFHSSMRKDTCSGDSGGPLVCRNNEGNPVLTGIVSVGQGCALEDFPGIYTRVGAYRDWILTTMIAHTGTAAQRTTTHATPAEMPL